MATAGVKTLCITCKKEKLTYSCEGCLKRFCFNHLAEHRQELEKEFDEIEDQRNVFRQTLSEQTINSEKHILFEEINQWEEKSILKIKQTANNARESLLKHTNGHIQKIQIEFKKLTEQMKEIRDENDFNEINLNELKIKLNQLEKQFNQPENILIKEDSTSTFINKISVTISSGKYLINIIEKIDLKEEKNNLNEFYSTVSK